MRLVSSALRNLKKASTTAFYRRDTTFIGKRLNNVEFVESFTKSDGAVPKAAIRVKQEPLQTVTALISFLESVDDKLSIGLVGNYTRDDFSGKKVDDNAKIMPFGANL